MTIDIQHSAQRAHHIQDRDPGSFARARKHSRYVGVLKIGLPVGALILIAVFAGWAWLSTPEGFTADVAGSAVKDGKLVMANPKLNGFTDDNLPYAMTAERAIQDLTEASRIALEKIDARLPIEAESWADITADNGVFDNESNTLDVTSPMTIRTNDGLLANLKSAFVDMNSGRITSSDPVSISMKGSTLEAEKMAVEDRGKIIVFEDRVRMTILPDQLKAGDKDE